MYFYDELGDFYIFFLFSATALCTAENLAPKGKTSQSSDYIGGGVPHTSERAVDGNLNICAHTLNQSNNWWSINLQDVFRISKIRIYNRVHHNHDLTGAKIYIGNSREKNGPTNPM